MYRYVISVSKESCGLPGRGNQSEILTTGNYGKVLTNTHVLRIRLSNISAQPRCIVNRDTQISNSSSICMVISLGPAEVIIPRYFELFDNARMPSKIFKFSSKIIMTS